MKTSKFDTNVKKAILGLKTFPKAKYEGFDLDRLGAYTLFVLEEKKIPLYFDLISVGLFKLFPRKFSMANFIQYPDTNRINKTLRRVTDQKRKRWAIGNIENGFHLTDLGREMARQVSKHLANPKLKKPKIQIVVSKSRGRSFGDDVKEIREADAFRKWLENGDINNYEFFAFLKAAPHTPKQLLAEHMKNLRRSADAVKDKEAIAFLTWLENKFNNLIY